MDELRNPARERLARGELALGLGIRLVRTVEIAKLMKTCGFDWLFLDLEHGVMALDQASEISIAALDAGIAPIVRVPRGQYDMAARALDGGAWGIVMPHVDTAEEAAAMVAHLKYPPEGRRSSGGVLPHFGYRPMKSSDAALAINAAVLLVAMIETPLGVANADRIAAVPGIDALLIGTNDLTLEMGISGELGHKDEVAAYETVIAACHRHGKWPGLGGINVEEHLKRYIAAGVRLVLCGSDLLSLRGAATARAAAVRGFL